MCQPVRLGSNLFVAVLSATVAFAAPVRAQSGNEGWEIEIPLDEGVQRGTPSSAESPDGFGSDEALPPADDEAPAAAEVPTWDQGSGSRRSVFERLAEEAVDEEPADSGRRDGFGSTDPGRRDGFGSADPGRSDGFGAASPGQDGSGASAPRHPGSVPGAPQPGSPPAAAGEGSGPNPGAQPKAPADPADPRTAEGQGGAAAEGGAAAPDTAGKPAEPEPPKLATELVPPEEPASGMLAHWATRRRHQSELDPVKAGVEAEAILRLQEALDVRSLPHLAVAVLREGQRDLERGDAKDALAKADLAARLAPELAAAEWFRARARAAHDLTDVGGIAKAAWAAAGKTWKPLPERRRLLANLALVGLGGLLAATLVFLVLLVARVLKLFLHDFHHLFPTGASRFQTGVVAVGVLVVPLVFQAGLLVWILVLAAAAWVYLDRVQKGLVATGLALVAATPWLTVQIAGVAAFWGTPAAEVWALEREGDWAAAARAVAERVQSDQASYAEVFALARHHKREGRLDEAGRLYQLAITKAPHRAEARNNLGVVQYAQGDLESAKASFKAAIERDPAAAAAYHNLAKIHFRNSDLGPGQEARRRAVDLDPVLVERHPDVESRLNRAVADMVLPDEDIAALAVRPEAAESVGRELRVRTAGLVPLAAAGWLPAGGLVVLLLLGGWLSTRRHARTCVKCGRSVCRRCDKDVGTGSLCGQCVNAFQKQGVVPPQVRVQKELSVRRYQAWRDRTGRAFGLLLPGAGHVILGRTLRGALFLALFLVGGAFLVLGHGPVPGVRELGGLSGWRILAFALLSGGAWLAATWDLFRREV